jgi:hypothetical protein
MTDETRNKVQETSEWEVPDIFKVRCRIAMLLVHFMGLIMKGSVIPLLPLIASMSVTDTWFVEQGRY